MIQASSSREDAGIPLYLFTYNCNKRPVIPDLFSPKLVQSFPDDLPSLFVFGVEEVCSILDGSFEESSHRSLVSLNKLFLEALNEKYGRNHDLAFHTLGMEHLGAIGIIMITPYPSKFFNVRSARSSCGYFYSSMKGAVGLRVSYSSNGRNETSMQKQKRRISQDSDSNLHSSQTELTFVNAHLAAFEGEYYYHKRNLQVLQLMRSLDFSDGYGFLRPDAHSFFMGDLNYRTTKKVVQNSESLLELTSLQDQTEANWSRRTEEKIEKLVLKYDELMQARADGDVFTGFSEPCIGFAPTYKFLINTAIYNTKRSPSWCDRILYQSTYDAEAVEELSSDKNLIKSLGGKKESFDIDTVTGSDANSADPAKKQRLPLIHTYNSIKTVLSDHQPVYLNITVPTRAPESILASNGYLQVLPSNKPNLHFHHKQNREQTEADVTEETEQLLASTSEVISGPTQIYMYPTKLDSFIQTYLRAIVDFIIGYGLWFGTTPKGRLTLLAAVLTSWLLFFIF